MKVRKYEMKKAIRTILICTLVFTCFYANTKPANAKADMYKITKYDSFSAVQKDYLTKELYRSFGLRQAYKTMKTKWGDKKAMIINHGGFTADLTQTDIFVKHKKKVYRIAHFMGYADSISNDKKYMFISGSGTYFMIYKYSGGVYKKYKFVENNGQKKYDKQKQKLLSKYGVNHSNISYA